MKKKPLLDEHPLLVLPSLAVAVGLAEAIILQQVHYWTINMQRDKTKYKNNFKDGRYWVYNSYNEWAQLNFPFWKPHQIRFAIKNLEKKNILISAKFNKAKYDQTKWYSINYEILEDFYDLTLVSNPYNTDSETDPPQSSTQIDSSIQPIPETTPETTPEIITKENLFTQFWIMYDKKRDLNKCKKAFMNLKQTEIDLIFQHLPDYIAATPNKKYRKDPLRYLTNKSWNDEIIKDTTNGSTNAGLSYRRQSLSKTFKVN